MAQDYWFARFTRSWRRSADPSVDRRDDDPDGSKGSSWRRAQSDNSRRQVFWDALEYDEVDPREALLRAGVLGTASAKTVLADLRRIHSEMEAHEEKSYDRDIDALLGEYSRLLEERDSDDAREEELRTRIEELEEQETALESRIERQDRKKALLGRRLGARRLHYGPRLLSEQLTVATESTARASEALVAEEEKRIAAERMLLKFAQERREMNADEYQRRVDRLQGRHDVAASRHDRHRNYVDGLRSLGITRTTSGFLLWAGYLGFTALGWLFGHRVLETAPMARGFVGDLLVLLASSSDALIQRWGLIVGVATLLAAPFVLMALIALMFWGFDWLLGEFDPKWRRARQHRKDTSFLSQLRDWGFGARGVGRPEYAQAIAKLPLFALWLAGPFLLAVLLGITGSAPGTVNTGALRSPADGLVFAYFGVVVAIMLAAFVLVYVTRVVEPRFRHVLRDEDAVDTASALRLNAELVVGLVVLVTVLTAGIFYQDISVWSDRPIETLSLLLLANAFVAAYGSMFRGVFRDEDALRAELQEIEDLIESYAAVPAIDPEGTEVGQYRERLRQLRERIDDIWDPDKFIDTPDVEQRFWSWSQDVEDDESHPSKGVPGYVPADDLLEPELVARIDGIESHTRRLRSARRRLNAQITEVRDELKKLDAKDWEFRLTNARSEMRERREDYLVRRWKLQRRLAILLLEYETLYQSGTELREDAVEPVAS